MVPKSRLREELRAAESTRSSQEVVKGEFNSLNDLPLRQARSLLATQHEVDVSDLTEETPLPSSDTAETRIDQRMPVRRSAPPPPPQPSRGMVRRLMDSVVM